MYFRSVFTSNSLHENVIEAISVLKKRRKASSVQNVEVLVSKHGNGHSSSDTKEEIQRLLQNKTIHKVVVGRLMMFYLS